MMSEELQWMHTLLETVRAWFQSRSHWGVVWNRFYTS